MSVQPISGGMAPTTGQPAIQPAPTHPVADLPTATANTAAPNINDPRLLPAPTGVRHSEPDKDANSMREAVEDAVQRANETVQVLRSNLQFTVDRATGIEVVKFIDIKTKEVIRQIPSEEMLALARRLDEIKGLLIKDKA